MKKIKTIVAISVLVFTITTMDSVSFAQPYGKGIYDSSVSYGGQTSLSISTDGNVSMTINPNEDGFITKDTSLVTVTSTDVVGYKLYIKALNTTDMTSTESTINASTNDILAPLNVNTWGYNTNGSDDFLGIKLTDTLIRSRNSPTLVEGETTSVTYGINIDMQKSAGNYTANIVYTAVPQTY